MAKSQKMQKMTARILKTQTQTVKMKNPMRSIPKIQILKMMRRQMRLEIQIPRTQMQKMIQKSFRKMGKHRMERSRKIPKMAAQRIKKIQIVKMTIQQTQM